MYVTGKDKARSSTGRRYVLCCPAGCRAPLAEGQAEAARLVREHPAVCPDPGPALPESTVHPLVYADREATRGSA